MEEKIDFWDIFLWITAGLSALGCIWFQILYHKFVKKTLALKMIAILSFSNFFCHLTEIASPLIADHDQAISTVFNTILSFTMIWSSSIAFIVSNSVTKVRMNNPEQYFRWCLLIFFLISGTLCLLWTIFSIKMGQKVFAVLLYPYIFSISTMGVFYYRSVKGLRTYPVALRDQMKTALQKLFYYPFAQLLFMTPSIILTNIIFFQGKELSEIQQGIAEIPLSLLGLVNALICAVQQRKIESSTKSTLVLDDLEYNQSFLGEDNNSDSMGSVDSKILA